MLATSSCVSDADIQITGADSRIYFYTEFEPGHQVKFKISTVSGLNDKYEFVDPVDMNQLNFTVKQDNQEIVPAFRYNEVSKLFEAPAASFNPQEKSFYSLNTSIIEYSQIPAVHSETFVPIAEEISSLELLDYVKEGDEYGELVDMTVRVTVPTSHPYYELEVYQEKSGILEPMAMNLVKTTRGVLELTHRNSFIIDSHKNDNQFIDLNFNGLLPFEVVEKGEIYFKLKSVNRDHYLYHENVAKRIEADIAPLSEPVISYTNIEGGLGLFSAFSSTIDTLSL